MAHNPITPEAEAIQILTEYQAFVHTHKIAKSLNRAVVEPLVGIKAEVISEIQVYLLTMLNNGDLNPIGFACELFTIGAWLANRNLAHKFLTQYGSDKPNGPVA